MNKERGTLGNNVSYIILQDGPQSFHVTVSYKLLHYYAHVAPNSIEELRNEIDTLSNELLAVYNKEDLTNNNDQAILHNTSDDTLNTNLTIKEETNEQD